MGSDGVQFLTAPADAYPSNPFGTYFAWDLRIRLFANGTTPFLIVRALELAEVLSVLPYSPPPPRWASFLRPGWG